MADPAPVAGMFWLDEELGMAVLVNLQYDHGRISCKCKNAFKFSMEITSCHSRGADVYLDGVITVVDSKHCLTQMKETRDNGAINEWLRQVGH